MEGKKSLKVEQRTFVGKHLKVTDLNDKPLASFELTRWPRLSRYSFPMVLADKVNLKGHDLCLDRKKQKKTKLGVEILERMVCEESSV